MRAGQYALAAALLACSVGVGTGTVRLAHSQPAGARGGGADEGKRIFMRANCMGCHKWHGGGGGGYGGDALSLRNTQLDQAEIIETIGCGRPGTGMPHFLRDAYDQNDKCFGLTRQDIGDNIPPQPQMFLRPSEIEAVADYVVTHLKGKGEPNYAECLEFFGEGSRVCNVLKQRGETAPATGTASPPARQGG
jgi:Cytochrome c